MSTYTLGLEVQRLIALCLQPGDRHNLEQTSWQWLLAVWHGPERVLVRKLVSFVYVATLVAPYGLDPPRAVEFRCNVTENAFASAAANGASSSAPSRQQHLPLLTTSHALQFGLVFNDAGFDLAALRRIIDPST